MSVQQFSPSICPCCGEKIFLNPQDETSLCPCCGKAIYVAAAIKLFHTFGQRTAKSNSEPKDNNIQATTDLNNSSNIPPINTSSKEKSPLIKYCLMILLGLFFLGILSSIFGEEHNDDDKTDSSNIKIGTAASGFNSQNYLDVVDKLRKKGFTDICTEPVEDLITGFLTSENSVKEVSIDGKTNFKRSDYFPKDAKIIVRYHTFPGKGNQSPQPQTPDNTSGPTPVQGQTVTSTPTTNPTSTPTVSPTPTLTPTPTVTPTPTLTSTPTVSPTPTLTPTPTVTPTPTLTPTPTVTPTPTPTPKVFTNKEVVDYIKKELSRYYSTSDFTISVKDTIINVYLKPVNVTQIAYDILELNKNRKKEWNQLVTTAKFLSSSIYEDDLKDMNRPELSVALYYQLYFEPYNVALLVMNGLVYYDMVNGINYIN